MVERAGSRAHRALRARRARLIDSRPRKPASVLIHLNGRLVDERDAHISVLDRGFLFGDGVYELVRYFDGRGVALEAHAARLARSLAHARIAGFDAARLGAIAAELLEANGLRDATVYLQVTRGAGAVRSHVPTTTLVPTVVAFAAAAEPLASLVAPAEVAAITAEDTRWRRCEIKTVSLMGNILHLLAADDAGAAEAILHRGGLVGEGGYSNVAIATGGALVTPPLDEDPPILHGTARADLLDAAREAGVPVAVRPVALEELRAADEVLITSSRRFVNAVVRLDGATVGGGAAGPLCRRLFEAIRDRIARGVHAGAAPCTPTGP
jgi:D-alanine transaminase